MAEYVAGRGTTALGIIGTVLGGLATVGEALPAMNGAAGNARGNFVTKETFELQNELGAERAKNAILEAGKTTDAKIVDVYKQLASRDIEIEKRLGRLDVEQQANKDSFLMLQQKMASDKAELECAINREKDERKCNDNILVTYMNASFYPKQVADVTVGTATTAQTLYNPLPVCNC